MSRWAVVTMGRLSVDHIAAVEGLQGPVTIERRCTDLPELIAVCRTGRADAALIIGETHQLTATVLGELQAGGRHVVVISHVAEERSRLQRLGVLSFTDEVSPSVLAQALMGAEPMGGAGVPDSSLGPTSGFPSAVADIQHSRNGDTNHPWPPTSNGSTGDRDVKTPDARTPDGALEPENAAAQQDAAGPEVTPDPEGAALRDLSGAPRGITVVWGAPGSPGRSTVAVNLAAELALQGASVLLIDADTIAASLVAQLGLMEETAGLARVCRAADLGRLDAAALQAATTTVQISGTQLSLLSGLPRAQRWPELRERSLGAVLELVRSHYAHVIIDVAAPVEEDEELSFDTTAPQRNAATLTCLRLADRVLAVGAADPVSFPRLVKAVEALALPAEGASLGQPEVVINKVRSEVIGSSPRDQLSQTWLRLGPAAPIQAFLPWDPAGCDAALLHGQVLAEAAPDSALRRSIARLAGVDLQVRRRGLRARGRR
ncbi:AAA family ATPase [Nesterenkonia sandarakina]|uniref:MinD-like ATPase involved in chromosome partitioning or flagellar assembly n=1 Tax=Nesterenkonia sandarakina TaxID=272918 RepID=A0A2T0YGN2_9MICC|nr:AAA family ATPase [Nesterenkonia sandarakina]PRZ14181.1 MinD-like ATPase involved in chromosome partitioning or flagellar assembly [Nesterenkonia sandarakina]